jgi:CheY-like chemotaxis protein
MADPGVEPIQDPGDAPGAPPLIAVVDDEPSVVKLISRVLERVAGYRTIVGYDGGDAVSLRFGEPSPDAMIINLVMPRMHGDAALDIIREREHREGLPRLPIALESADARVEDFARDHGADAWLLKFFSTQDLLVIVERLLAMRADAAR